MKPWHKKQKKCITCEKQISDVSTYCRKCSRVPLFRTPERVQREKEIIDMKKSGKNAVEIGEKYGFTNSSILNILKKNGVDSSIDRHKYTIDENCLDEDSNFKYYFLGLMAADGCVSRNRTTKFVEIGLKSSDVSLLNDLRSFFKTDKPFSVYKNMTKFTIFSEKIYDICESYGIGRNKSLTLKLKKEIPKKYMWHFLRGVFDGDGSLTKNLKSYCDITLAFSASEDFANQIFGFYSDLGIDVKKYKYSNGRKNALYYVKKSGKSGLKILANFYKDGGPYLARKYEIFLNHTRLTIDEMMMENAYTCAKRSSCIRKKVGAVLTDDKKENIIAIGYNGQVKGDKNTCDSSLPGQCGCLHAELNCLLKGSGTIMYCTLYPCTQCQKMLINAGVKIIFFSENYRINGNAQSSYSKFLRFHKLARYGDITSGKFYGWKLEIAEILSNNQLHTYPTKEENNEEI